MKKGLALLGIVMIGLTNPFAGNAQIQQGNWMVGGEIADFSIQTNGSETFSMSLDPKLAYFVRDNFAIGAYVGLGIFTQKNQGANINYGLGALSRYFFNNRDMNVLKHGRFFLEGTVGIEGINPAVGDNTNGLGLGIGPGFSYFITPNIGVEGLLKYDGIVGFGTSPTSGQLNLGIGFQIYLPSRTALNRIKDEQ